MLNTKYTILAIGLTLTNVYLSSIPGNSFPGHGSFTSKIIFNLSHIPTYTLITLLWLKSFKRESCDILSTGNKFILLGLCLFAGSDEIHQAFVPGRTASLIDIGLDLLGIIVGLCIFKYIQTLRHSQVN